MHVVVLGSIATGIKAAAKLDCNAAVTVYTKSREISHDACAQTACTEGGRMFWEELALHTPAQYEALTGIECKTGMEAVAVDVKSKTVHFAGGETASYDKLVLATGMLPSMPEVPGMNLPGTVTVRNPDDAAHCLAQLPISSGSRAVVVGGGWMGLEMAENLSAQGLHVTVVEQMAQLVPGLLDREMAEVVRGKLQADGICVVTDAQVETIQGREAVECVCTDAGVFPADVVFFTAALRPATDFLSSSGIAMRHGQIVTGEAHRTNIADVYAVGGCARVLRPCVAAGRTPCTGETLSPDEIKRVKGMGFLQDKRYGDVFNARVITRNGRISTAEHRTIAEAADQFGSGAVAMTTRQTLEIQGIPYANIAPLTEFLSSHGLATGGTGPLVRPVVSCKGTTCQYGLIDTYDLSEKIHKRFYEGCHTMHLPHKFKIAVGGCPNNCVKPNLNDLGIIGQRVPTVAKERCRGCKVCQVEKNCPMHAARVENGHIQIDANLCNHCGRCKGKCPFDVLHAYHDGYLVTIGGRWGKKTAHGVPLRKIFATQEEVLAVVERAILLFRDEGAPGERFADTVARLGFDYVNEKLVQEAADKTKPSCQSGQGGASC